MMKYYFFTLLIIHILSSQIFAHPHMFVDVRPYLISIKKNKVVLIIKWYFDEFTSQGLFTDYDQNSNGVLEKSDKKAILKDFGTKLKTNNYFMKILLNNKKSKYEIGNFKIKTKKIRSKKQSINDIISGKSEKSKMVNIIYYEFNIILKNQMKKNNQLNISFYDPTIYSVLYPEGEIIVNKGITVTSNKLNKSKCLFQVEFKL